MSEPAQEVPGGRAEAFEGPLCDRAELEPLSICVGLPQMVAYAGATWDWYRLHYDADFARARGLAGPVVDGQALGAYLARLIGCRLGPNTKILELSMRYASPMLAGETVVLSGVVSSDRTVPQLDGSSVRVLELELAAKVGERDLLSSASAKVQIPVEDST
jgi:acyl dehydratase